MFYDNFKNCRKIVISFLFLLISTSVFSENFRVNKTSILNLNTNQLSCQCGVNDIVAIKIPTDLSFVQGIELNIKLPTIITSQRDSVIWGIYNDLSPEPMESKRDYYGNRISFGTCNNLNLNIKIPLTENNTISKDNYSVYVEKIPDCKNGYIIIRFQVAMKGVDERIYSSKIDISCKPILSNFGKLIIDATSPDGKTVKDFDVYVDEKLIEDNSNIILSTGSHFVNIQSDDYTSETRNITIEQGKTTNLSVQFNDLMPKVVIGCPSSTKVFIDNKEIPSSMFSKPIGVSQGSHSIKFVIGDYEILKNIEVTNGNRYNVNVNFDVSIKEQ